jgi:hypothetical protein
VRKRDFFVILFAVIICISLSFAVLAFQDTYRPSSAVSIPEIVPGNQTQDVVPVLSTSGRRPDESRLEIYDPDTGKKYQIFQDQGEYGPLLDNMTAVLQSIKFQMKCSRPYGEFQIAKLDFRYAAVISSDNVSGRYCYNNISAKCMNITADEFTVLLQKKTGNSTDTGCGESGLIFAYRNGTDGGIWSLGEEDSALLEGLNRNVRDVIEHSKQACLP